MHLSYWLIFYLLSVGSCGKRKLGLDEGDGKPPDWQQHWARGRELDNSQWHLPPDGSHSPNPYAMDNWLLIPVKLFDPIASLGGEPAQCPAVRRRATTPCRGVMSPAPTGRRFRWASPFPVFRHDTLAHLYSAQYTCNTCGREAIAHSCHLSPHAARLLNVVHMREVGFDRHLFDQYANALSAGQTMHGWADLLGRAYTSTINSCLIMFNHFLRTTFRHPVTSVESITETRWARYLRLRFPSADCLLRGFLGVFQQQRSFFLTSMARLTGETLSADHTYKIVKRIKVKYTLPSGRVVYRQIFAACYIVMNEAGQVVSWTFVPSECSAELDTLFADVKRRCPLVRMWYTDSCCRDRRYVHTYLGGHVLVQLDSFHAIQRIVKTVPRSPVGWQAMRDTRNVDVGSVASWEAWYGRWEYALSRNTRNAVDRLLLHVRKGCLQVTTGGTQKNENFHRWLLSQVFPSTGLTLHFAWATMVRYTHHHNYVKQRVGDTDEQRMFDTPDELDLYCQLNPEFEFDPDWLNVDAPCPLYGLLGRSQGRARGVRDDTPVSSTSLRTSKSKKSTKEDAAKAQERTQRWLALMVSDLFNIYDNIRSPRPAENFLAHITLPTLFQVFREAIATATGGHVNPEEDTLMVDTRNHLDEYHMEYESRQAPRGTQDIAVRAWANMFGLLLVCHFVSDRGPEVCLVLPDPTLHVVHHTEPLHLYFNDAVPNPTVLPLVVYEAGCGEWVHDVNGGSVDGLTEEAVVGVWGDDGVQPPPATMDGVGDDGLHSLYPNGLPVQDLHSLYPNVRHWVNGDDEAHDPFVDEIVVTSPTLNWLEFYPERLYPEATGSGEAWLRWLHGLLDSGLHLHELQQQEYIRCACVDVLMSDDRSALHIHCNNERDTLRGTSIINGLTGPHGDALHATRARMSSSYDQVCLRAEAEEQWVHRMARELSPPGSPPPPASCSPAADAQAASPSVQAPAASSSSTGHGEAEEQSLQQPARDVCAPGSPPPPASCSPPADTQAASPCVQAPAASSSSTGHDEAEEQSVHGTARDVCAPGSPPPPASCSPLADAQAAASPCVRAPAASSSVAAPRDDGPRPPDPRLLRPPARDIMTMDADGHCLYHALLLHMPASRRQAIPNIFALRGYIADYIERNLDHPILLGEGFDVIDANGGTNANVRSYLEEAAAAANITPEEYIHRTRWGQNQGTILEMHIFSMVFRRRIEVWATRPLLLPELRQVVGHPDWPTMPLLLDWSKHPGGHYDVIRPSASFMQMARAVEAVAASSTATTTATATPTTPRGAPTAPQSAGRSTSSTPMSPASPPMTMSQGHRGAPTAPPSTPACRTTSSTPMSLASPPMTLSQGSCDSTPPKWKRSVRRQEQVDLRRQNTRATVDNGRTVRVSTLDTSANLMREGHMRQKQYDWSDRRMRFWLRLYGKYVAGKPSKIHRGWASMITEWNQHSGDPEIGDINPKQLANFKGHAVNRGWIGPFGHGSMPPLLVDPTDDWNPNANGACVPDMDEEVPANIAQILRGTNARYARYR